MPRQRPRSRVWIVGCLAAGLLASMWLPWFGDGGSPGPSAPEALSRQLEEAGVSLSANAWEAFAGIDLVLLLTGLAGLVLTIAAWVGVREQHYALARRVTLALSALSVVLILYRVASPAPGQATEEVGVFVGLAAAAGIAYGALESPKPTVPPATARRGRPSR